MSSKEYLIKRLKFELDAQYIVVLLLLEKNECAKGRHCYLHFMLLENLF